VPAIVLVHGLLTGGWIWEPLVTRLGRRHRVRVVELPGHGARAAWPGDLPLGALADELAALCGDDVVLVGHSLGAIACAHAAARARALAGLVLVAMPLDAETPASRARRLAPLEAMARLGVRPVLRGMAPWLFGRTTRRERPACVERWLAETVRLEAAGVVRTAHAALARPDAAPVLARVRAPVLVVTGDEDDTLAPDEARRTAAHLARGTLCELRGCGHLIPIERGDALATVIEHWLEGGPS